MPSVLITGANRGLGLEFTRQYAADGWRVFAACRDPAGARDLAAVEGDVSAETLDVDDGPQVAALANKLSGQPIDVLINNAGIYGPKDVTRDTVVYDAWGQVFRTNAMSPLAVSAAFAANVAQGGQKKIITLSSIMGSIAENDSSGDFIYRSSKAAVNAVMKSLAGDLKSEGITVAVLHPGWVRTDMGGPDAAIEAPESVTGMRAVIAGLKESDSGRFLNYDGTEIPW
ncbi:MAG TPA: SDR family oxidoreductase [Rhodospirillales bacterium]|jgi:NAD(P)-dependent dehydrogenase (short-subunit alcohol dehydrogenase family)|nr:MAG: C-factor [Alphaproteobacteria bacterium MarineAlpha3_Bin3]HIM42098.1 SDR family oxidoreductase [Rhodospirillales bacterium]